MLFYGVKLTLNRLMVTIWSVNIVFISFVFIILLQAKGDQGPNFQQESPDNENVS
jgi:hypothetical protein